MWNPPNEEPANWLLLKAGDSDAFTGLYRTYARLLVNYGYRLVPDKELVRDVVQDLFVQLWSGRSTLPDVQSVKAYLIVSLRRQLLRRTAVQQRFDELHDESVPVGLNEPSAEIQLINSQTGEAISERITKAIETLPPRQREVIFLKYYSELSTAEIAETMGITSESVYKLIYKAIDKLKSQASGWETAGLAITLLLLIYLINP